jgi:16S rRNA (guanine527-N7)-methyltransferase
MKRGGELVVAEAERLGVALPATASALFDKYLGLLNKWAAAVNLVATSDPTELARMHLGDCLSLVPHLGSAARVVDVGAGGGLPGIVLAIALPDRRITSLEPTRKKHAFLSTARRELGLDNFTPLPERDDAHRERADFAPYDAAVSRATWAPVEWFEHGRALVRPGGRVLAMEGREQTALAPGVTRHPYVLGDRTRAILVVECAGGESR